MYRILGLALLAAVSLTGCGQGQAEPDPNDRPLSWSRLSEAPLSPRTGPVTAWTGTEVLVIGGEIGDLCPANADCFANESARDGAALDPDFSTWRPIAPAPVRVPSYSSPAVVEGHLYLAVGKKLLDYDVDSDEWQVLPLPASDWYTVVADGERLLLVSGSDEGGARPDLSYLPATKTWSELPEDPLGPMFDRSIITTTSGLLLIGKALVESPGSGDQPSYVLGALLDRRTGTWSKLPASDQLGGGYWGAIGSRVVNVALDRSNGGGDGAGDYGRQIPFGGVLDLESKTWGRLPNPPKYLSGGWAVGAVGQQLIAAEGWIYNDALTSWTRVPRPRGGAVQPGPAVWADERLIVIGGTNQTNDNKSNRDSSVWSLRPEIGPRL